ncbi:MAG: EAL domain-containing protein [Gammaproteobacteria bacterium]|nr:EAL domain-containing protein [Gammaproteobacteria bacterium]
MEEHTENAFDIKNWQYSLVKNSPQIIKIISAIIISASLLVLTGWIFDIPLLKSLSPSSISMKFNSAICFLLSGFLILLTHNKNRNWINYTLIITASILLMLISSLTLYEFFSNTNLGIDELVIKKFPLSPGTQYSGRMSLLTAMNFLLISLTFLYLLKKNVSGWIIQSSAWLVFLICLFCFYNYINKVDPNYFIESSTVMARHTIILFCLISVSILLIKPGTGIVDIILRNDASGYLLRFMLPVILFIPMFFYTLVNYLQNKNLISVTFGNSIQASATFAITGILIAITAQLINLKQKKLLVSEAKNFQNDVVIRSFAEHTDTVFFIITPDFQKILYASPAYENIWGKKIAALTHNPLDWYESIIPDDKKLIKDEFFDALINGNESTTASNEFRIRKPNGNLRYLYGRAYKLKDQTNEVFAIAGIIMDITKEKLEKKYKIMLSDLATLLENKRSINEAAPNIIKLICKTLDWELGEVWLIDESTHTLRYVNVWYEKANAINYINESSQLTFEFGQGLPGRTWKEKQPIWVSDYAMSREYNRSKIAEQAGYNNALAIPIIFNDTAFGVILFFSYKIEKPSEQLLILMNAMSVQLGQYINLTYNQNQIQILSRHDILTGFLNRSALEEELNKLIVDIKPDIILVIMIDIDNFKIVNEALGYDKGDLILKLIAKRLEKAVSTDKTTVARLGADKFILYTYHLTKSEEIHTYINQIEKSFLTQFKIDEKEIFLKASIGIAVYPENGANSKSLISNADLAMRRAKNEGGNKSAYFTHEMPTVATDKLDMHTDLIQAMAKNQFYMVYQPQIDLKTGKICGAETLVRWQHPTRGLVLPGEFIPFAEKAGLIVNINEHIMRMVFQKIDADWKGPPVSINISAQQFKDKRHLIEYIESLKTEFNVSPKNIEFEITEGIVLDNLKDNLATLNEIESLGYKISIDDFGTGFSSFSYLHRIPAHKIKIDISFIRGLPKNEVNALIVRSMIVMLHALEKIVVAEGAETEAEVKFLKHEKCDIAQGYYYDKPMPLDDLIKKYISNE